MEEMLKLAELGAELLIVLLKDLHSRLEFVLVLAKHLGLIEHVCVRGPHHVAVGG